MYKFSWLLGILTVLCSIWVICYSSLLDPTTLCAIDTFVLFPLTVAGPVETAHHQATLIPEMESDDDTLKGKEISCPYKSTIA